MAEPEATAEAAESAPPLPCAPCRGTGKVISGAGGTQREVPCPWCDGTGTSIPGHDAQAARRGEAGAGEETGRGQPELEPSVTDTRPMTD
jgi:DnaJ-class molecular chaperone